MGNHGWNINITKIKFLHRAHGRKEMKDEEKKAKERCPIGVWQENEARSL